MSSMHPQASFITLFATIDPHKKNLSAVFYYPRDTFGVKIEKYYDIAALDYAKSS